MTAIRTAAPRLPQRAIAVAKPAAAPAPAPAPAARPAPKPAQAVKAQGGIETTGKILGGIAGGVAGTMGGSAVGLVANLFLAGAGGSIAVPLCAIGFGALGAWAGARNGGGLGYLIESFFGKN